MAGRYNLEIEQGSTFERFIVWQDQSRRPLDLSNYIFRMHIGGNRGSSLLKEISSLTGETYTQTIFGIGETKTHFRHVEHYGKEPSGCVSYLRQGEIRLFMSAEETALLDFTNAYYVLEAVPANFIGVGGDGTWTNIVIDAQDAENNDGNGTLLSSDAGKFAALTAGDILMIALSSNSGTDADSNYGFYVVKSVSDAPGVEGMATAVYFNTPIRGADAATGSITPYKVAPYESHVVRVLEGAVRVSQEVKGSFEVSGVVTLTGEYGTFTRVSSERVYRIKGRTIAPDAYPGGDTIFGIKGANLTDGEIVRCMIYSVDCPITYDYGTDKYMLHHTTPEVPYTQTALDEYIDFQWNEENEHWNEIDRGTV